MNKILTFIFLQTLFILTGAHSYSQNISSKNPITFKQKDKTWVITNTIDSIRLVRDSFCIRFESKKYDEKKKKFYATQIAAVTEDSCIKYMAVGQKTENIPYFSTGTGLAGEAFEYLNLFIDNEAHHYIFYESEKERRATLLSQHEDMLQLEWCIPQAFYNGADISFKKLPFEHFYLIIFNDSNLNEIVDAGEYKIISVTFDK